LAVGAFIWRFQLQRNWNDFERFHVGLFIVNFRAAGEENFRADFRLFAQLQQQRGFDDMVQLGGHVVEILRVRKLAGVEQARAVAHSVAEEQSGRQQNIGGFFAILQGQRHAVFFHGNDMAGSAQEKQGGTADPQFAAKLCARIWRIGGQRGQHLAGLRRAVKGFQQSFVPK